MPLYFEVLKELTVNIKCKVQFDINLNGFKNNINLFKLPLLNESF